MPKQHPHRHTRQEAASTIGQAGSPERLWSKDQAASRLRHRGSAGRLSARRTMRPKLVSASNRFRGVATEARILNDAAGGSFRKATVPEM
jgi:hypothetical protein